MSGMEVITVVACVAAIVSAYRDGCELYHKLKVKRERRRHLDEIASHSAELEDSLARGHEEILAHWNSYASRLGRRYEEGDSRAREQIKDIVITVQSMLLSHLRRAVEHGVRLDILELLSTSNLARKNTLSLLQEMYQRISPSPHLPYTVEMSSLHTTVDPSTSLGYYIHLMDHNRSLSEPRYRSGVTTPPKLSTILSGQLSVSPTEIQGLSRPGENIFPPQRERKSSGLGLTFSSLWSHRPKRGSGGRSSNGSMMTLTEDTEESQRTRKPSTNSEGYAGMVFSPDPEPTSEPEAKVDRTPKRKHRRRSSTKEDPSHTEREEIGREMKRQLTRNPWIERSEYGSDTDSDGSISPTTEQPPKPKPEPFPTQPTPSRRPSHPNPPTSSGSISNHSTHSTHSSALTVVPPTIPPIPGHFWPPSKANNYSGFCKGAWKLSSGLGGFKTYTEPIGYYLLISKWRCYRCYFGMPLAPGSNRHDIRFDQKIYQHQGTGIRYRWSFLAKCHLAYNKPGVSAPTHVCGSFGCVFCCAEMNAPAPRMESLEVFMGHLGAQHRVMDVALLERTRCVVGRVAGDEEGFDINIPPARVHWQHSSLNLMRSSRVQFLNWSFSASGSCELKLCSRFK